MAKKDKPLSSQIYEGSLRMNFPELVKNDLAESDNTDIPVGVSTPARPGTHSYFQIPIGFDLRRVATRLSDLGPKAGPDDARVRPLATQPPSEQNINNSLLPVMFLQAGVVVSRAVARVAYKGQVPIEAGLGTGFMVSPTLFMTNNHVLPTKEMVGKVFIQFNYQYDIDGITLLKPLSYELDPDAFFYTSLQYGGLDFTLVRVKPRTNLFPNSGSVTSVKAGDEFGYLQLGTSFVYSEKEWANIIQHPQGRPKEVSLQANQIVAIFDKVIHYTSDTDFGSSGSPVFNNSWYLIALHHAPGDFDFRTNKYVNNEGIRIDRIVSEIKEKAAPNIVSELQL